MTQTRNMPGTINGYQIGTHTWKKKKSLCTVRRSRRENACYTKACTLNTQQSWTRLPLQCSLQHKQTTCCLHLYIQTRSHRHNACMHIQKRRENIFLLIRYAQTTENICTHSNCGKQTKPYLPQSTGGCGCKSSL